MIPSIPQPLSFRAAYGAYVVLFFVYLVLPLVVHWLAAHRTLLREH